MRPIADDVWVRRMLEHGQRHELERAKRAREALAARPGRRRDRAGRRPRKRG
jgi:hypothetical protein